jgi:hypothetical protein
MATRLATKEDPEGPADRVSRRWLRTAPPGTLVPVEAVRHLVDGPAPEEVEPSTEGPVELAPRPWRVLLWEVPAETRLGVEEVLEAVGRPRSWVYRRTGPSARDRIPHRRLDGALVFLAGELRAWLRDREDVVEAGPVLEALATRRRA